MSEDVIRILPLSPLLNSIFESAGNRSGACRCGVGGEVVSGFTGYFKNMMFGEEEARM